MKKFYLYRFTMETPIGNLHKSEISNYSVTNLDLRFGFTEDWKRRKQDFKSVYLKRGEKNYGEYCFWIRIHQIY